MTTRGTRFWFSFISLVVIVLAGTFLNQSGMLDLRGVFVVSVVASSIIHLTIIFLDKIKHDRGARSEYQTTCSIDETGLTNAYYLSGVAKYLHVISVIGLIVCSVSTIVFRARDLDFILFFITVLFAMFAIANILVNRRRASMNYDMITQSQSSHDYSDGGSGDLDL